MQMLRQYQQGHIAFITAVLVVMHVILAGLEAIAHLATLLMVPNALKKVMFCAMLNPPARQEQQLKALSMHTM
jgi:hypothetical protein